MYIKICFYFRIKNFIFFPYNQGNLFLNQKRNDTGFISVISRQLIVKILKKQILKRQFLIKVFFFYF